jgi:hypothetical protein
VGRYATVPTFNIGRIGAAPTHGPSRMRSLLSPRRLPRRDDEGAEEDGEGSVFPPELMFALAVAGMESAEESPASC